MEENTAAVECLILFYINTKHVLKTKQLDERVFLDQMMRHCRECGFDGYSNEEIRNTWKNLTLKYVELKKTGTTEEKESWKYYEILDSCFEQSDFHNGVYPKFSEEMVWFLIECFLKRKGLEKAQKKNNMLTDIHKEFLQSGYLYITRQDIENKWKYLNFKYDKLKDDPEALSKLPYLQSLRGFRDKDNKFLVKMIFTRGLTEILIERFTEKKITCVIHGYDSEQVLSEIQSEFRDLGFDFTQEEIKERWRKLINVYSFLKTKGKHDSSWIYFSAMREHFKDDFLFGLGKFEKQTREERQERHKTLRQRSKSVGADARKKYNNEGGKTKLIVSIEQLDGAKLSPSPKKSNEEKKPRATKRKPSPKKRNEDFINDVPKSPKKSKVRSKSKEGVKKSRHKDGDVQTDGISVRKNHHLKKLSIDRNINQERRGSADLNSPGSKVHIINIDESKIDKKSGNITINLPSITKQFSDNEFLPLKKRLRLGNDKHTDEPKGFKDGFLGFPPSDASDVDKRLTPKENEDKRLTDEEMAEIMKTIHQDKPENYEVTNNIFPNENFYKPDEFNYNYQEPYTNFTPSCLIIPKEEQRDNLSIQNYSPNTITPPPVLLLVIKVDGSNNLVKDSTNPEDKKQTEKNTTECAGKNESPRLSNLNVVKPISPVAHTVTKSEYTVSVDTKTKDNNSQHKANDNNSQTKQSDIKQSEYSVEVQCNDLSSTQVRDNGVTTRPKPSTKSFSLSVNEKVTVPCPENNNEVIETQNKLLETDIIVPNCTMNEGDDEKHVLVETIPFVASETVIPATPVESGMKKIRLPVKGGGKLKEIFLSPRELKKLAKIKPGDFRPTTSQVKTNSNVIKNTAEVNPSPHIPSPKIKFISHVIKPPTITDTVENKLEVVFQKPRSKVNAIEPTTDNSILPPSAAITSASKFLGTNNSNMGGRSVKNEDFENESVFSEAIGDDDCLKDNLLATVIDFQEQNNQEFVEIKNLMKQNNLLQRETNRLLRLMLEKM